MLIRAESIINIRSRCDCANLCAATANKKRVQEAEREVNRIAALAHGSNAWPRLPRLLAGLTRASICPRISAMVQAKRLGCCLTLLAVALGAPKMGVRKRLLEGDMEAGTHSSESAPSSSRPQRGLRQRLAQASSASSGGTCDPQPFTDRTTRDWAKSGLERAARPRTRSIGPRARST